MITLTYRTAQPPRKTPLTREMGTQIEELARHRLAHDCPYAFYFRDVSIDFADGTLTLEGRVPTFYMKQVLQSLLIKVDGVRRVDNRVAVTSATGLSSV